MEVDWTSKIFFASEISEKIRNGEYILSPRTGRSKVWKVFDKVANKNGVELDAVHCRFCNKVYKHTNPVTSNLARHSCYIERYVNAESETSMMEKLDEHGVSNLTKLFTKWIIRDCKSYDLIENEGLIAIFQEVASLAVKLNKEFELTKILPRVSDVSAKVSKIYEQSFESLKSEIAAMKEIGFGLTASTWIDSLSAESYIVLTMHYVKSGALTSRLLGLRALESTQNLDHHGVEKIKQILEDYDCQLSDKLIIVTDSNNGILKDVPEVRNLPCISQLINDALLKAIAEVHEVSEIINGCSRLVNILRKINTNDFLYEALNTIIPNRWITVYKMLKSVDSNWNAIEEAFENINDSVYIINRHHLKAVIKTFQAFEEAIETLEESNYGTLHLVVAYLYKLKKACDTDSECKEFDFIEDLKETIRVYLEKIDTENITILHKVALFLYPPTNKLLHFSNNEKKSIEDECIRLMKGLKREVKPVIKQEPESLTTSLSKRIKLFSDFLEYEGTRDPNELIMQEIQYYKNTRVVNCASFNEFSWWEQQKDNFPLLYKLSCTILSTPATCAASKIILSYTSSLLCGKAKQYSKEKEIEKIIFINSNTKNDELDSYILVDKWD